MQRRCFSLKSHRIWNFLLLTVLAGSPFAAIATIASVDVVGTSRRVPTTMGALEMDGGATRPAAPTGLTVTPIRN